MVLPKSYGMQVTGPWQSISIDSRSLGLAKRILDSKRIASLRAQCLGWKRIP